MFNNNVRCTYLLSSEYTYLSQKLIILVSYLHIQIYKYGKNRNPFPNKPKNNA